MNITKGQQPDLVPQLRGCLDVIRFPAFGEVKFDGEYNLCDFNGECFLKNKYGKMRSDMPAVTTIERCLRKKGVKSALFLGELFFGDGHNGDLYNLLKNKGSDDLNYLMFDIAYLNGEDLRNKQLIERKEILLSLLPTDLLVMPKLLMDKQGALDYFKDACSRGYEGAVIKNLEGKLTNGACAWVKLKHKDESELEVVFIDPVRERIEVRFGAVSVGVKVCNKNKATLQVGDKVIIQHQGVLSSGSLRHPTFVRRVK